VVAVRSPIPRCAEPGHTDMVSSLAFWPGPGGRPLLASAGGDETVRLWDPATGAAGVPAADLIGHRFAAGPACAGQPCW
jgi:WD40 repeat protein